MDNQITVIDATPTTIIRQADSDQQLIELWLHGRSEATQRAYRADANRFGAFVAKPLSTVTLADLQSFAESLTVLSTASRARTLAAIKSLFAFGKSIGYLPFDPGAVLKLPKVKNTLAERIIGERAVLAMLGHKHEGESAIERRNRILLTVLYAAGLRVSEVCSLRWRDAQQRDDGGQITVFGKGGKTRTVRLPASVWNDLAELRGAAGDDDVIFQSREGGALDQSQVNRIVHAAAKGSALVTE